MSNMVTVSSEYIWSHSLQALGLITTVKHPRVIIRMGRYIKTILLLVCINHGLILNSDEATAHYMGGIYTYSILDE